MKTILIFIILLFSGCSSTSLVYDGKSVEKNNYEKVSISIIGEPVVTKTSFSIYFKFESPTDDENLIQQIRITDMVGIESFGSSVDGDHHWTRETTKQIRKISIFPGEVEGTDETAGGFAMLPSSWDSGFNWIYRYKMGILSKGDKYYDDKLPDFIQQIGPDPKFGINHKIQGKIVKILVEHATVYWLEFEDGKLTFRVEGTDIEMSWTAE